MTAAPIIATIMWEGRSIRLSYRSRRWGVIDHLEIETANREALPISETGYLSQFFGPVEPALTIEEIIETVRTHLETAARNPDWLAAEGARKQLTLFE